MAVSQEKIERAKKLYGISDDDVKKILTGQAGSQSVPPPISPQQPQQTQQRVSSLPAQAGSFAGSIAANAGGAAGRLAGAPALAGFGQQAAEMAAGKPGDPMAALSPLGPLFSMLNAVPHAVSQVKGEKPKLSSVEKTQQSALGSQAIGETLGALLSLLKPGTTSKLFSDLTDFISEKSGGKVPMETVKKRFLTESVPKAVSRTFREPAEKGATKILEEMPTEIPGMELGVGGKESLNYFRKKFNSIGGGKINDQAIDILSNDLARILKEEQLKLAPMANVGITGSRVSYQVPNTLRQLPFGRFLLGTGAPGNEGILGLLGSGVSSVGKKLSRYVLPSQLMGQQEE